MDQQLKLILKLSLKRTIVLVLAIAALSCLLIWLIPTSLKLNVSTLYSGVVTLGTGSMVAIFLAVFYSTAERIQYIRQHLSSASLFIAVLIDLLIIVLIGVIIGINHPTDLIALSSLLCVTVDLCWLITSLVLIALKR